MSISLASLSSDETRMTQSLRQVVRWGVKSSLALAANVGLLTVWVDGIGVPPEAAVLLNIPLITSVAYVVTDKWVFSGQPSPDTTGGISGSTSG